jgi:hypothetical protein
MRFRIVGLAVKIAGENHSWLGFGDRGAHLWGCWDGWCGLKTSTAIATGTGRFPASANISLNTWQIKPVILSGVWLVFLSQTESKDLRFGQSCD